MQFFGTDETNSYDFFCHAWDYNTWKRKVDTNIKWSGEEIVDREWLKEQLESLNPISYRIESLADFEQTGNRWKPWASPFYSMMVANDLKRRHERANNFRYDWVVKARYDMVFEPGRKFRPPLYVRHNRDLYFPHTERMALEYNWRNASDPIFFGDSWGMDILTDIYRVVITQPRCRRDDWIAIGPGVSMTQYMHAHNCFIHTSHTHNLSEIYYRKEMIGLDAIDDFDEIKKQSDAYYEFQK